MLVDNLNIGNTTIEFDDEYISENESDVIKLEVEILISNFLENDLN